MKALRWQQRFENFEKALLQLEAFLQQEKLNDFELQGLIKAFEYTFELSWNVVRDYLISQGNTSLNGSRDAFREAFRLGIISNGEAWMEMILDRNKTSHAYSLETVHQVALEIRNVYIVLFRELKMAFQDLNKIETGVL